jgi:hypothetical protein
MALGDAPIRMKTRMSWRARERELTLATVRDSARAAGRSEVAKLRIDVIFADHDDRTGTGCARVSWCSVVPELVLT